MRRSTFAPVDYRLREHAMRRSSAITIIALGAAVAASDAEAKLDLFIDKSTQQISVSQNGRLLYVWPVSTGQDRFSTPSGVYTPERLERTWFSKAYYNSPMPMPSSFTMGLRFTAAMTSPDWEGRPRMAAFDFTPKMPPCCTEWSSRKAPAIPRSWSEAAGRQIRCRQGTAIRMSP